MYTEIYETLWRAAKRAAILAVLVVLSFSAGFALRAWLTPHVIVGTYCAAYKNT